MITANFKDLIDAELARHWDVSMENVTPPLMQRALSSVIKDLLSQKRQHYMKKFQDTCEKQVYYLCMEFLVGKSLRNNLFNLEIEEQISKLLHEEYQIDLADLYEIERDPGLGNGGLGRLAACFLDSLATQNYPVTGFSIKYEFGLFKQKLIDGWQTELPDDWLTTSYVWLSPRFQDRCIVRFDGAVHEEWTSEGLTIRLDNPTEIEAVPYDMMISGYSSDAVSLLRLWEAHSLNRFDMNLFSQGEYIRAMSEDSMAEAITKVLYPSDNHVEGKELRLKQQYFLVSSTAQGIVSTHYNRYKTLDNFSDKTAIHINDTHPALVIPELLRIFMDEYRYSWDRAWDLVTQTVSYTNHTVLPEALERFQENIIQSRLPRIYMIIQEINRRFIDSIIAQDLGDASRANRMSIFSNNKINMANLCIVGSYSVNGVAGLHTEILKKTIFKDFYDCSPKKFLNVTNGITHRRWLNQANPLLANLLDDLIGPDYRIHSQELSGLLQFKNDDGVLAALDHIKLENKKRLAEYIQKTNCISINVDSIFDIQAKRLHEYKRQLLNALRIISLIIDIQEGSAGEMFPETFIFAAKAAPGYFRAKEIIQLIYTLSGYVNGDDQLSKYINVVFLENYSVSLAEIIMPAGELSEQISLAGKEASGTGNMKFMLNGAITIGTYDGANVEMIRQVGEDNFFLFGLKDYEVENLWCQGYNSIQYLQNCPRLHRVIDFLNTGISGRSFESISKYLLGDSRGGDPYMCFADFESYFNAHEKASSIYCTDKKKWNQMSLSNIAAAGYFSSDRTVKGYSDKIWNIKPFTLKD
ncbi:glycogen/starch/alpha-glucan phosphorylase [Parasporobacterium paucivorans]|uniref:Alpha-1,4 glucan phosphorylase n=1 Tax=Parasporobacterium paucivorans DSM 15970 TaxID=1122934 RepID=A0A1M6G6T3_9FIRM|nr:glycogen/starch/alpha-glucan phosphorylase [Parasporobacterium paucivorans]SHJ05497.1 starch phosphorylase [Parasporobacterium paucivorans DSM 15970]